VTQTTKFAVGRAHVSNHRKRNEIVGTTNKSIDAIAFGWYEETSSSLATVDSV